MHAGGISAPRSARSSAPLDVEASPPGRKGNIRIISLKISEMGIVNEPQAPW
ncbi:MAG: hypothetical protein V1844_00140 [Pseudomonadota bacterium]